MSNTSIGRGKKGSKFWVQTLVNMQGGEIYVKKIPSMNIIDIARAIDQNANHEIVGIRPGEKLHEQMIGPEDAHYTYEYFDYFKILPAIFSWYEDSNRIKDGKRVADGFTYASNINQEWMSIKELETWVENNQEKIGRF